MKSISRSGRKVSMAAAATLVATTVVIADAGPASAYCLTGSKWSTNTQYLSAMGIPSGHQAAVKSAATGWNNVSSFKVTGTEFITTGPPGWFSVWFRDFSAAGLPGDPGLTTFSGSPHVVASVRYNSDWKWNTSGNFNQSGAEADVRTVVLHEFGHAHGLHHPWACGAMTSAEKSSVMNATFTKKWTINSDDSAGMNAPGMY